ncbi:Uncharacterized protein RNJ44_03317 [Nakaseomyces bracarensis]|uniref:Uncharacterized protein n=1 Tax=Nakaseomyces bracarensis TaxID=273131 RepID=A0ABR4NZZ9_9SACH
MSSNTVTVIVTILVFGMSLLRRYKPFRDWFVSTVENGFRGVKKSGNVVLHTPSMQLGSGTGNQSGRLEEYVDSLISLRGYLGAGQRINNTIVKRTKSLRRDQYEQLKKIEYFNKIDEITNSTVQNSVVVENIIENALKELVEVNKDSEEHQRTLLQTCTLLGYNYTKDQGLQKVTSVKLPNGSVSNSSAVSESLSHLCRDWSEDFKCERDPLFAYICDRIDSIPTVGKNVLVVVPGSGVGNLAFSIAEKFGDIQVDSIEMSAFMYICNRFALGYGKDTEIKPFSLFYSGQLDSRNQTRSMKVNLSKIKAPENLNTIWGDFREYSYNIEKKYDTIIVCSAYFIDTAENLFEYFESIEKLQQYSVDKIHWINIGPLKYGTRPKVQLTVEELTKLRKLRSWKDDDFQVVNKYNDPLNGYLTDYQGLYQGYYGLVKFHSTFHRK